MLTREDLNQVMKLRKYVENLRAAVQDITKRYNSSLRSKSFQNTKVQECGNHSTVESDIIFNEEQEERKKKIIKESELAHSEYEVIEGKIQAYVDSLDNVDKACIIEGYYIFGATIEELAKCVGKSNSYVANTLKNLHRDLK